MRMKLGIVCSLLITPGLCLSAFGFIQFSHAIVRAEEEALSQVAPVRRAKLVNRLELYFGSLSRQEFDTIYDLRPDACRHGLSKDEWLREVRYESLGRIQRFVIEEVYSGDYTAPENLRGEKWIAKGCGTYVNGKESAMYRVSVGAVWVDGEWYFCSSGIAVEGADNQHVRCPGTASNNGMHPTANSAARIREPPCLMH